MMCCSDGDQQAAYRAEISLGGLDSTMGLLITEQENKFPGPAKHSVVLEI